MTMQDFRIQDVQVRQVPRFNRQGNQTMVTRVTIFVGDQGPFTQDFGPGTGRDDTPEAINSWKQQTVTKVQSVASS